jgi:hypothetical protein
MLCSEGDGAVEVFLVIMGLEHAGLSLEEGGGGGNGGLHHVGDVDVHSAEGAVVGRAVESGIVELAGVLIGEGSVMLLSVEFVGLVIGEIEVETDVTIVNFIHGVKGDGDIESLGGQFKLGETALGSYSVGAAFRVLEGEVFGNWGFGFLKIDGHLLEFLDSAVDVVIN